MIYVTGRVALSRATGKRRAQAREGYYLTYCTALHCDVMCCDVVYSTVLCMRCDVTASCHGAGIDAG